MHITCHPANLDTAIMSVDPKTHSLFEAIAAVNYDRVKLAIDSGASIDSPNERGQTPLAVACRQGNLEIVDLLVAAGAQMQVAVEPIPQSRIESAPTPPSSNATVSDRSGSVLQSLEASDRSFPAKTSDSPGVDRQIPFENLIDLINQPTNSNATEIEQFVLDDAMSFPIEMPESPVPDREISFENLIDLIDRPASNTTEIEQFVLDDAMSFGMEMAESPVPDRQISFENLIDSIERPAHSNGTQIEQFLPIETQQLVAQSLPQQQTDMRRIAADWQDISSSDAEATYTFDLDEVFAANEHAEAQSLLNNSEMFVDSEITMTSLGAGIKEVEFEPGETYAFDLSPDLERLTAEAQEEPDRLSVPMGAWGDNETYVLDNLQEFSPELDRETYVLDDLQGFTPELDRETYVLDNFEGFIPELDNETYVLDNFDGLAPVDLAAIDSSPVASYQRNVDVDSLFVLDENHFGASDDFEAGETYAIDLEDLNSSELMAGTDLARESERQAFSSIETGLFPTVGGEDEPDFDPDTQTTTDIFGQSKAKSDEDDLAAYEENATNTSLMAAVIDGDLDLAQQAIEAGANLDRYDWNLSYAPLGMAIDRGHLELVQCLLSAGANPHCGSVSTTTLGLAAERGEVEIIQMLLPRGIDVNAPVGQDGWTALLSAIKNGHRSVVQLLVTAGANVNVWSRGETPILLAAKCEEREIYHYLYPLVNTAIRLCADRDGEHMLQATRKRRIREQDRPVEKFLEMATIGNVEEVQRALEIGIEVDELGAKGHTALMAAAYYGHRAVVKILLAAGADPNLLSDDDGLGRAGMTALMLAVSSFFASNRHQVAQQLIAGGADVNQRGIGGKTAIMYAALAGSGYTECVEALLAAGADLDLHDDLGHTVLSSVAAAENYPMFNLLMQAGASTAGLESIQLIQAAGTGNVDRVKSLLANHVNLDLDRGAAIGNAAAAGHTQIVELLIKAGANVNLRDKLGFTPIASAAYAGYGEIVQLLIDAGADIQAPAAGETQSYSALEYAQMGLYQFEREDLQHAQIIRQLQQLGAR
jgi:ankyrin repeat protein